MFPFIPNEVCGFVLSLSSVLHDSLCGFESISVRMSS
jgi:hypothetical protein